MVDPQILFQRWFAQPLEKLKELPDGDGGFIALATSCFLYERYATATIKAAGGTADTDSKIRQLETDFQIDILTAKKFWDVIRNGLLHQGMPKSSDHGNVNLPKWAFHHKFNQPIQMGKINGDDGLLIEPWRFTQRVIQLWQDNLMLIDKNDSFPWANIMPMITYDDSEEG
jgi:hypothetical protein